MEENTAHGQMHFDEAGRLLKYYDGNHGWLEAHRLDYDGIPSATADWLRAHGITRITLAQNLVYISPALLFQTGKDKPVQMATTGDMLVAYGHGDVRVR